MDTMNFWISSMKDAVIDTIKVVDCIIINDAEARQFTDEPSIYKAARSIMDLGLKAVVIKRGEYGATLFTRDGYFVAPAYPLESVFDPTGAFHVGLAEAEVDVEVGVLGGSAVREPQHHQEHQTEFRFHGIES
jgi:hypothetical protein